MEEQHNRNFSQTVSQRTIVYINDIINGDESFSRIAILIYDFYILIHGWKSTTLI